MKRCIIFLLFIIFFVGCGKKNSNQPARVKNTEIKNVKIDHPYELGDKIDSKYFKTIFYYVKKNGLEGIIKKDGENEKIVIPIDNKYIYFYDAYGICYFHAYKNDDTEILYTLDGECLFPEGCEVSPIVWYGSDNDEKYFCWSIIRKDKENEGRKVGIMDLNGKYIIPLSRGYSEIHPEVNHYNNNKVLRYFIVKRDNFQGLCDQNGNEIIAPDEYTYVYVSAFDSSSEIYITYNNDFEEECILYPNKSIGHFNFDCSLNSVSPFNYSKKSNFSKENSDNTNVINQFNSDNYSNSNISDQEKRQPIKEACRTCKNTGRCYPCDGTGKVISEMSLVTDNPTYMQCRSCRGSGWCSACGGDGWLDEGIDF